MSSTWVGSAVADTLINPFNTIVEKDNASKGSFLADYDSLLAAYSIVRCPYVTCLVNDDGTEKVSVTNTAIDVSNWRALLLASVTVGSKVKGIKVHGCSISAQHIVDLTLALTKSGKLSSIKLQYLDLNVTSDNASAYSDAFGALFQEGTGTELIHISACGLTDSIMEKAITAVGSNCRLKALNLSRNLLTNTTATALASNLKFSHTLQALSLAENQITDPTILGALINYVAGTPADPTDDATIKSLSKSVGDKNKAIKDTNKKRKKAGQAELDELPALPEFVRTVDGAKLFINESLKFIDFSGNQISSDQVIDTLRAIPNVGRMRDGGTKVVLSDLSLEALTDYQSWLIVN